MLILGQVARVLAGKCAGSAGAGCLQLVEMGKAPGDTHCKSPGCFPSRNFLKSLFLGEWELTWGAKGLPAPGQMVLGHTAG